MKVILVILVILFIFSASLCFPGNKSLSFLDSILNYRESQVDKDIERISGGGPVLPDNPADYALYEKMESRIRELTVKIANAGDMISYYNLQGSVCDDIIDILQRIRVLQLQKSNAILSDSDRMIIDREEGGLYEQVQYDLDQPQLNGIKVFASVTNTPSMERHTNDTIADTDNLINFFIDVRTISGVKSKSLSLEINGNKINKENSTAVQGDLETSFTEDITALQKEELLMMIAISLHPK